LKKRILSSPWDAYELVDAGGGKKLERWGNIYTIRPEINAYFTSEIPFTEWNKKAHFVFQAQKGVFGVWKNIKALPLEWEMSYEKLKFRIFLSNTKHTGIFPEQQSNWAFIKSHLTEGQKFLNLFAYTGASSMIAKQCGAEVYHVDSSKSALNWAKKNQEINRFANCKWVHEDALLFLQREVKRNKKYQVIQMDPPAWGVGVSASKWKLEDKLDELVSLSADALERSGSLIVSTYSPQIDAQTLKEIIQLYLPHHGMSVGMLSTETKAGKFIEHGAVATTKGLLSSSED
jgi:23S rRNA (cytosine1962-C5)-methyltransferase